jgi:uncharacterized membrane protein
MAVSAAQWAIGLVGLLHLLFAVGELFPWKAPWILMTVIKKWPEKPQFSATGTNLVAMIVHNAGIYNGIVAAALFATALAGPEVYPIQVVLLAGGIVAGLFGCFTLSKATLVQAILGAIALAIVASASAKVP